MLSVDAAEDELSVALVPGSLVAFSLLIVTLVLISPSSHGSSVMIVPPVVVGAPVLLPVLLVFVTGVTVNESGMEVSEMGRRVSLCFGSRTPPPPPAPPGAPGESIVSIERPGATAVTGIVPFAETAVVVAGRTMTVLAPSGLVAPPSGDVFVSASSRLVPSLPNGDTVLFSVDGRIDLASAAVADWPEWRVLVVELESSSLIGASSSVPTTGTSLLFRVAAVDAG